MSDADDIIYAPIRKRRTTYEEFGLIRINVTDLECPFCKFVYAEKWLDAWRKRGLKVRVCDPQMPCRVAEMLNG